MLYPMAGLSPMEIYDIKLQNIIQNKIIITHIIMSLIEGIHIRRAFSL